MNYPKIYRGQCITNYKSVYKSILIIINKNDNVSDNAIPCAV